MNDPFTIEIEPWLYADLEKEAAEKGCTIAELVNDILRDYFESQRLGKAMKASSPDDEVDLEEAKRIVGRT